MHGTPSAEVSDRSSLSHPLSIPSCAHTQFVHEIPCHAASTRHVMPFVACHDFYHHLELLSDIQAARF